MASGLVSVSLGAGVGCLLRREMNDPDWVLVTSNCRCERGRVGDEVGGKLLLDMTHQYAGFILGVEKRKRATYKSGVPALLPLSSSTSVLVSSGAPELEGPAALLFAFAPTRLTSSSSALNTSISSLNLSSSSHASVSSWTACCTVLRSS